MASLTSYVYGKDYQAGAAYGSAGWTKCTDNKRTELTGGYRFNNSNWVLGLKFTMPAAASSVTLNFKPISGANNGADCTIRYKVFTQEQSSPNYTENTSCDGTFTCKNSSSSYSLTINKTFYSETTYYIYFWRNSNSVYNLMRIQWSSSGFSATYTPAYKLTISAGTGTTITVKRGNTTLSNGATINSGDVLTISASASTGYNTPTLKVNNRSFTSGRTHTVSGNVTVSATTTKIQYTVSYDANGGSGAPSAQTKTHGTDLTLSTTIPTKESLITDSTGTITISYDANGGSSTPSAGTGIYIDTNTQPYSFSAWNTKSNGSGTSYSSGGKYTANSSTTLYAQYAAGTITTVRKTNPSIETAVAISRADDIITGYEVSFNLNGGSNVTPNTITSTKTRKYTFSNWKNLDSDTEFSASTSYTFSVSATLTAQWITSDSNNEITLPIPTRVGYKFLGWAESAMASSGVTGSYTPTKALTLYAIWEALGSVKIKTEDGIHSYVPFIYTKGKWTRAAPFVYKQDKGWVRGGGG